MKDKKKAEEYYRKAIKREITYELAHFRLAMVMLSDNKRLKALEELNLALLYNPDFNPAYNELGLLALENGEYNKALESFKKAVSLDSTFSIAYYNMGGVLANMGKYREAARAYTNYLTHAEIKGDSTEVLARINILMSKEKD